MDPRRLGGAEAREAAQRLLEEIDGSPFRLLLTPPLPEAWPPAAGSGVVYWAYASRVLPTGHVRYQVQSPELGIRFVPTAEGRDRARVERLAPRPLATETRDPRQDREELDRAAESLFRLLSGDPAPEDRRQVHAAYRTWVEEHPVIGGEIGRRAAAFFDWLRTGAP